MRDGTLARSARRFCLLTAAAAVGCGGATSAPNSVAPSSSASPELLLIVDCLLPGQIRKLGPNTYLTARRPIKTPAYDCEIRGGEYVAYDRANYQTALKVWLSLAGQGDLQAQNYVGEIYEKGLGTAPDYAAAASWYRKAAEGGFARAQTNLGFMYERGLGVEKDYTTALQWYRRAAGLSDRIELDTSPTRSAPQGGVGPEIKIIEPPGMQTRGNLEVKVRSGMAVLPVVGKVSPSEGLLSLAVNDHLEQPDRRGLFRADIPVLGISTPVKIVAVDREGHRSEVDFTFVPDQALRRPSPEQPISRSSVGRFHALVIGNQAYLHFPALDTAIADAKSIADILAKKYGFEVNLMINADRYQILAQLNELREKLGANDNLLIYYAGHGDLDKVNLRGYWLPIDAERNSTANWVSNVSVTDILNAMTAKHVIVVADSCYSGALSRSSLTEPADSRPKTLSALAAARSRTVLSSGGLKPVLDVGGGKHSVFAKALLDVLEANDRPLAGRKLYEEVAGRVVYAALQLKTEQIPEYAPIKFAGHEAGDFVFVAK